MDPQLLKSHYGPRASIYAPLLGPGSSASQHQRAAMASTSSMASSSAGLPPLTGAMARVAAKQAELEGLRALREQSAILAQNLEALSERTDELVNGGEPVANVMSSWQGVFRAIMVAQSAIAASRAESIASANAAAAAQSNAGAGAGAGAGDPSRSGDGGEAAGAVGNGVGSGAGAVDTSLLGPAVPGTLVRIPVDLDAQQDADDADV
ncbi:unnamed protein product [Tilletia controversa]|uniref:DASH complex subunit DAD2 n=3 Tax=Tilletia TaxID=13289 RepID=A0A8X7SUX1_9BASI|nr:hypothetical protein CF328_g5614 [Tilletia controversa]KAE8191987.1 hypothetical protein CF336_g4616 [Tilletia laevis]KAE8256434.1 hypothetical protein A4X03_0g5394 [Tilletia caries]KAE8194715.1 hypothetical protein CF335_g5275 [Tilletia laevis]KAE8243148.1 hypothetical protein A4X06_0g6519 [Tilletia controversa]